MIDNKAACHLHAPNVFLCRANPKMQMRIGEYNKEDVVLMLPNGLTVEKLRHFQVWCKTYKVNFGEWSMP